MSTYARVAFLPDTFSEVSEDIPAIQYGTILPNGNIYLPINEPVLVPVVGDLGGQVNYNL